MRKSASKVIDLSEKLTSLADTLGLSASSQTTHHAETHQTNTKNAANNTATRGAENMDIIQKWAESRQKKAAAAVTVKFEVEDGPHKVVLSTKGDIEAYHNNVRLAWNPLITNEQYAQIAAGNGNDVASQLLSDLARTVNASQVENIKIAEWTPNNDHSTNKENQLEDKRTGEPGLDVKEHLLSDKAGRYEQKNTDGTKTREEELESDKYYSKRGDEKLNTEHYKERENMLKDDAGLYGQRDSNIDVREHLLADARKGNPELVIEEQLDNVRTNYGPGAPNLTVQAALQAMSKTVVSAKITPEEVVDIARKLAAREDFADLIKLAELGKKSRDKSNARKAFHNTTDNEVFAEAILIDELGREITSEVFAADLAKTVKVATSEESGTIKSVTRIAKSMIGDDTIIPNSVNHKVSYEDKIRAALATVSEDENLVGREHARAAIESYANTVKEIGVTPREVISAIKEGTPESLIVEIELARTASAVEARLLERERNSFFGNNRIASKKNIRETMVGWLADYCKSYNFPTASMAYAATRIANVEESAVKSISKLVKAAVSITDEETTTKRIVCRVDDLGGLDPKSENFKEDFRQKAIEILASSGYHVDPTTFNLSDVSVSETGDINASVTTRFSKSFKAEGSVTPSPADGFGAAEIESPVAEVPPTIITSSALKARKARREALIREAQAAPGMPPMGGAPMGAPMGANPMDQGGAANAADGLGMSALTTPTQAGGSPIEEDVDTDNMSTPGEKQPWGTVCPQCGSRNVEVASGEGQCNDCGALIEFSMIAKVKTDGDKGRSSEKGGGPDNAEQSDALSAMAEGGLGGATAPAPAPEAGTPGPSLMQASYHASPDVFVRFASGETTRDSVGAKLPVGEICPQCGNRQATKVENNTFCRKCATWAVSTNIVTDDNRVKSVIRWLVP